MQREPGSGRPLSRKKSLQTLIARLYPELTDLNFYITALSLRTFLTNPDGLKRKHLYTVNVAPIK